jgi:hypothetical protein
MKSVRLKKEYVTSVTEQKPVLIWLTDSECIKGTSTGSIDHPKFSQLRDKLEQDGYIKTERAWWNGDRVLKKFIFNGMTFKVGDSFPCASAMSVKLSVHKKSIK